MDKIIQENIAVMLPLMNEKQKRIYLAGQSKLLGVGGLKKVSKWTGVSQTTIIRGKKEIAEGIDYSTQRIREIGGGRKAITVTQENIVEKIEELIEPSTLGNPENPLRWTTKSLNNLKKELSNLNIQAGTTTIRKTLIQQSYSLQLNQKMLQVGEPNPDRNAQFEYINDKTKEFIKCGQPVISIDTKKKENVGNFKNNGREYSKKNEPTKVLDHDFPLKELGKVAPYGVYDIDKNTGFVNLGISHDTAEFAVESILRWWKTLGKNTYPTATKLYINCDGGGSNGSKVRLWKKQLQELANLIGLEIHVSHFPPGTSKWNKIEHKMFCFISKNWRGTPLISIETIINLISNTTTAKGLKIICEKDENTYELGTKVSDEEFENISIQRDDFHGEWNYVILNQK